MRLPEVLEKPPEVLVWLSKTSAKPPEVSEGPPEASVKLLETLVANTSARPSGQRLQ